MRSSVIGAICVAATLLVAPNASALESPGDSSIKLVHGVSGTTWKASALVHQAAAGSCSGRLTIWGHRRGVPFLAPPRLLRSVPLVCPAPGTSATTAMAVPLPTFRAWLRAYPPFLLRYQGKVAGLTLHVSAVGTRAPTAVTIGGTKITASKTLGPKTLSCPFPLPNASNYCPPF